VNSRQIAGRLELSLWLYVWRVIFYLSLGNIDVYFFIPSFHKVYFETCGKNLLDASILFLLLTVKTLLNKFKLSHYNNEQSG